MTSRITGQRPGSASRNTFELLRKLFLAFWAVAVLPVGILAFATRTYFASQIGASVEEAAVKTVTVAQRPRRRLCALQPARNGRSDGDR